MTWPLWLGAAILLGLLARVVLETRAYNRTCERRDFDERATRAALGYPVTGPHTAVNQALPLSVGTGGSAHEREFDEHQDTPG